MKVNEIMNILKNCDPESEVFIYEYDRGNPMYIKDVRAVNKDNCPYDRNGFLDSCVSQYGGAVLISDWKW